MPQPAPSSSPRAPGPIGEIAATFLTLGLTSFGGPIAHLGYFRNECVVRRKWITESDYASLVALCQLLPGPTSSQVAFGLGWRRAGLGGALAASAGFILPSALLMLGFAAGAERLGLLDHVGWVAGIKVAAVAVVAHATLGMARSLCRTRAAAAIALASAAAVLLLSLALSQPLCLVVGGVIGFWACRAAGPSETLTPAVEHAPRLATALACLALWALLLGSTFVPWGQADGGPAALFGRFFRAGSLVIGGGHVVLPLLRGELVPAGWLSDRTFLAGYGVAQLMPGPLFSVAAYYGSVARAAGPCGGAVALFGLYLPGWLALVGALPFWSALRVRPGLSGVFAGMSAAAVGLLGAALYRPLWAESIHGVAGAGLAGAAFACLCLTRLPTWLVVGLCTLAGAWMA